MKKTILRSLSIFLAIFLIFGAIPIGVSAAEDVIINDENGIPDSALYNYILSVSDSNNDGIIQRSEAETIKFLWCGYHSDEGGEKIKTLKGLNNLNNLVIIDVEYNALTTLDGIEGLNLWEVRARNNELVDISAVKDMDASLYYLDVQYNNLSKLPNMTSFNKLETAAMYIGTDFMYNKLTYNELYYNLPSQLTDLEYVGDTPWVEFQSRYQSPDPIPAPADIELNVNGVFVEGLIISDAILQVNQVSVDIENSVVAYDVNLIRDHEKIQPSGEITISIPSEYGDCEVFWIKDDGTKVNMNAEYVDGKYVFTTDHLSIYALVRDIVPTVPEPTATDPIPTETVPEPTETDPVPSETVPEPTETIPVPSETVPESTETDPIPSETVPEPTETIPVPTETVPEPTETIPVPTETVPEPTETVPVPTETVPVTTVTDPTTTEPTATEPTTTAPVVTPDTPSNGNNGSNGSSSNTPSGNSSNTNTSNGAVATGDMFGIDNSILIALILAATTAMIIASKKRKDSSK